ncbi:MAG: ATPase family associated with various cellular activities (AAA) [Lentisphaerae bacterium ADurb.BinA184]|nr:MAG: ATPase family associated with various cellular activities (AAA) [Lentisphaerae bacterium ADurb.BinA184]
MERADIEKLQQEIKQNASFIKTLEFEVGGILVGQEGLVDGLIMGLITNGHVLVEGVPGLAKTLAIKTLAQAIGGEFSRLQFTPDLLPADLTGTTIYDPRTHTFSVKRGPVFANIVLADEINRAPAKVQSALLEAMQERQVTLGGETLPLPSPFLVMATQNPIEHEGTYPLPEAQVDRFMLKVVVTYPSRVEEREIIERMAHPDVVIKARQVTSLAQIVEARGWVDKVYMDPKITEYILDLVFASRGAEKAQLSERQAEADLGGLAGLIQYGASPRAALALALAAKARGFMDGRAYVVPQDVKDVAPAVLRHRIIPTYEAEAENLTTDDLVRRLLDELRTP